MLFSHLLNSIDEQSEGPKSLYSIAVTVYEVNQVAWENLETRVCVQLAKVKKYTKVKESSERPYYNEHFTFDYEGSLEKMMDMILIITVQNYRAGLRFHKVLGSARLDLGAIWSQPGHGISDKWILLTHPSDPSGHIRGYLNCEIAIIHSGEKPPIRRFHEPTGYFIPESQGGGRLKARYIFRIHRGADMGLTDKKGTKLYVRVFFAGLSGETTKRKNTSYPVWKEEVVFTELFPPMYNRIRIDVHFGKNQVCTKYLDLSAISDPAVKGYLPTYGPSFLYLYNPPFQYLGCLLVSLETLTVQAFSESEKLLGVKRHRTQEIVEKLFWNMEEFALFGVIYEVSMLQLNPFTVKEMEVRLAFATSQAKPFSFDNRNSSVRNIPVEMDGGLWCWPNIRLKSTVFTKESLPDLRHRLYVSNRLHYIAKEFGNDLSEIQFLVEHTPETSRSYIDAALKKVIDNCRSFKSKASPGATKLDQERFKSVIAKVNKILKEIKKIKTIEKLSDKFQKCTEVYVDIVNLVSDPQDSFPWIVLTLKMENKIVAYGRVHPRNIIFSLNDQEQGQHCGRIQSVLLKGTTNKSKDAFSGKLDLLLWLGPYKSLGFGIMSIPRGFQDISEEMTFPAVIRYTGPQIFTLRGHLYQGHFLPCDEISGTCAIGVLIYINCKLAISSFKENLSPVWMETLVIKNIEIYNDVNSIVKNPPQLVFEVWSQSKKEKQLLGRQLFQPRVSVSSQPPHEPLRPMWRKIHVGKYIRGEVLASFELTEDVAGVNLLSGGGDLPAELTGIPDNIKFRTSEYRLELLLWGLRGSKSLPLSFFQNPRVIINCGPIQWTSFPIKNPSTFPNFNEPLLIANVELPEDWLFAPPFVVRLYDSRAFGTQLFIGSYVVRNIKQFVRVLPRRVGHPSVLAPAPQRVSLYSDLNVVKTMQEPSKEVPIVDLLDDVSAKRPLKLIEQTMIGSKVSTGWKKLCWCCYPWRAEDLGYISLGLVHQGNDPDVEEEFFDWWTKYFDSLPWNKDIGSPTSAENSKREQQVAKSKTAGINFYTSELENQPEFLGFEDILKTFKLTKPSWRRLNDTGIFKGSVALYKKRSEDEVTMEGYPVEEGLFSGVAKELGAVIPLLVRVYVIKAHQLARTEKIAAVNPFIEICLSYIQQKIFDMKHGAIKNDTNPVFGKCFELEAKLPFDSSLTVRVRNKTGCKCSELIGETDVDIENRYHSRHRGTCGLQRIYALEGYNRWRDVEKPTEILIWKCISHNLALPHYGPDHVSLAGLLFTLQHPHLVPNDPEIKKENLALSVLLNWNKIPVSGCRLLQEHVETRSLYSPLQPGIEKGRLEMWIDLFPLNSDVPAPVSIAPRIPERYELRAIVWSTFNVTLVDAGAVVGKKNTDIFVKGWLKGKEDLQRTDVHYASMTGEGLFNWRFVFPFSYDRQEKMILLDEFTSNKIPPILTLQVWDNERLGLNQYLGALSLDLRDLPPPSRRFPYTKRYIPVRGWKRNLFRDRYARGNWPFVLSSKKGKQLHAGMVDLELSLLSGLEVERSPAGRGRNDPDALPHPVRPVIHYTMWIVPFRAIKNYLWTYHSGTIIKGLVMFLFGIFMLVMIYALPNYTVKKFLRA